MVWSGKGFWAIPIIIFCVVGVFLAWPWVAGNGQEGYYVTHNALPPLGVGWLLAGVLLYLLGKHLNRGSSRLIIDPTTGREMAERPNHHAFYLPVEYWGVLSLLMGLVTLAESFF